MASVTIETAVADLKRRTATAEQQYARLVQTTAAGESPADDALVVLSTLGKSMEQFQTDCQDAAAAVADRKASAEAARIAREDLPRAQQAASVAIAAAQAIGDAIDGIVGAVTAIVRPEVERQQNYVGLLFGENSRLRSRPNWFALVGRRERIKTAEYVLKHRARELRPTRS